MEEKQLEQNNKIVSKKQIGVALIAVASVLFVLTTFNFLYPIKAFFLGTFGIMLYPILMFVFLFGLAFISNREFVYSPKYILFLALAFFFLMCVIHIIFTNFSSVRLSYGQYLRACFYSVYTPGGLFVGIFTFPVTSLLHDIAGIVIYAIAFIILLYFILSYLDGVKKQKITRPEEARYKNFETVTPETPLEKADIPLSKNEEPLKRIEKDEDEEIIIKDSKDTPEVNLAREKLGLLKKEEQNINISDSESASSRLFGKTSQDSENWHARAMSDKAAAEKEEKPLKFVYNQEQKKNPMQEKNKEYLKSLYDFNSASKNPIINAENFEDYKQKIENIKASPPPFKRDFEDLSRQKELKEDKSPLDSNFGIEPKENLSSFDDFIRPQNDLESKISPINPLNFEVNQQKYFNSDKENESSQKFLQKASPDDKTNIEAATSLNNTYNLPRSFKNVASNYRQLEIMGTEKQNKKEPVFNFDSRYVSPPVEMLKTYVNEEDLSTNHERNIEVLERVLDEFKVPAKVEAVRRGASVTRYELHMPTGIPVRKIHAHTSDIALALAAKGDIRIETPIKGKSAVGIEVPNQVVDTVGLKEIIGAPEFMHAKTPLTFALGKDVDGNVYCCNLAKMPHLLVAGSTGSGKSVCLNSLILSLIFRTGPEDLRLILIDPKRVEFAVYNGLPHLLMPSVITEPQKALNAFDWLINEMERRFMAFQECYVKNINEYNAQPSVVNKKSQKMPFIVLIVDELADLVVTTNKKDLEEKVIRLTQKARAAGIHLILATQRPSVDIITGSIKINLPSRIAFAVTNFVDSKTILDQGGAEKLLGKGDMLYSPTDGEPVRVQGAFVDTPEVKDVVEFIKAHNAPSYDENVTNAINNSENALNLASGLGSSSGEDFDSLMPDALKLVIENGQASISMLQRRFSIGFSRAARIIDQMEIAKFISSSDGSKPRSVFITINDFNAIYGTRD